MLDVTPEARSELHGILMDVLAEQPPSRGPDGIARGLRIVGEVRAPGHSQLGLTLDAPRPGDEIVEHQGQAVLILDPGISQRLGDRTLDVIETPDGSRLGLIE